MIWKPENRQRAPCRSLNYLAWGVRARIRGIRSVQESSGAPSDVVASHIRLRHGLVWNYHEDCNDLYFQTEPQAIPSIAGIFQESQFDKLGCCILEKKVFCCFYITSSFALVSRYTNRIRLLSDQSNSIVLLDLLAVVPDLSQS